MIDELAYEGLANPSASKPDGTHETDLIRACWFTFWTNLTLGILEITSGALGYSPSLIVDGMVSTAIGVMATTAVLGIQMSNPATVTRNYSYGKGKIQFLAALTVGILLGMLAIIVLGVSIKGFSRPIVLESIPVGVAVALVTIVGGGILLLFLRHVSAAFPNSEFKQLVHLQTLNIAASIVVAQSYILMVANWPVGERLTRITISLIVIWLSILIIKSALEGVMDKRGGSEIESSIQALVRSVDEVIDVRRARTRKVGNSILVDLMVALDKDTTVPHSDLVAAQIKKRLSAKMAIPVYVVNIEFCTA